MMVRILQKNNPILRNKALNVDPSEIGSKKIKKIITDMKEALDLEEDGVAIAAPQIGELLRIFVMSKRAFEMTARSKRKSEDIVFINPKILKVSKEKIEEDEGCLSVRYLYGKVLRSKKATLEALDENGNKFIMGASGIAAQIFQHECDHLEGILFTDKAKNLREIPPEK